MMDERDARRRFSVIYRANHALLLRYSLRRAATPEDAADAVAEVFLVAWRRLEELPAGDGARLWLYGAARRVLANQRRAAGRRGRLDERLSAELVTVAPESADRDGDVEAARHAFLRLHPAQRDLLGLVAWEGLTTTERPAVLGCSENAAKIRLHRARRRFVAELSHIPRDEKPSRDGGHEAPKAHVLPSTGDSR